MSTNLQSRLRGHLIVVRAEKVEARANASMEAIKAAGEVVAELRKTAAINECKHPI